jgi:hypothetical protein
MFLQSRTKISKYARFRRLYLNWCERLIADKNEAICDATPLTPSRTLLLKIRNWLVRQWRWPSSGDQTGSKRKHQSTSNGRQRIPLDRSRMEIGWHALIVNNAIIGVVATRGRPSISIALQKDLAGNRQNDDTNIRSFIIVQSTSAIQILSSWSSSSSLYRLWELGSLIVILLVISP